MLEVLVCIIGLPVLALLSANEKGDSEDTYRNSFQDTKENRSNELRYKLDNMTTYEIDTYLKDKDLHNTYKDNSRQYKIDKIIERSR